MAPRIDQDLSGVTEDDMKGGGNYMAIETGEYPFIVTKSTWKPNNKGNGKVLGLQQQCLDPAVGKRVLFDYLSLENPSEEAVRIARAKLKQLAIAVGHPTPDKVGASEELHNKTYIARVVKQKADSDRLRWADPDGFENAITAYKPIGGPVSTQQPAADGGDRDEPPAPPLTGGIPF